MEKRKPKIGETLFLVDIGNLARDGRGRQRDCTVSRVGRKYFYVEYDSGEIQFDLENWWEVTGGYIADYALYESRQEWKDKCQAAKYHAAIGKAFSSIGSITATLSQLKQVAEILNIILEEDET